MLFLLPHPRLLREDVWDAGRIVPPRVRQSFTLSGLDPERPVTPILRAAPSEATLVALEADPGFSKTLELPRTDGWLEQRVVLGSPGVTVLPVRLEARDVELVLFHVWAVQPE